MFKKVHKDKEKQEMRLKGRKDPLGLVKSLHQEHYKDKVNDAFAAIPKLGDAIKRFQEITET